MHLSRRLENILGEVDEHLSVVGQRLISSQDGSSRFCIDASKVWASRVVQEREQCFTILARDEEKDYTSFMTAALPNPVSELEW